MVHMNVRLVEAKNKKQVVKKKYLTASFFSCKICKVIVMEEILKQTLLYDFYGELLTEHQRRVYEDMVFGDLSPSEIAGEQGISRQGVHDLIKRCDKILKDYEAKLHLVAKFIKVKEIAGELERLSDECIRTRDMALIDQIRRLSAEITSTL